MRNNEWPTLVEYLIDASWSDGFPPEEVAEITRQYESKLNMMPEDAKDQLYSDALLISFKRNHPIQELHTGYEARGYLSVLVGE